MATTSFESSLGRLPLYFASSPRNVYAFCPIDLKEQHSTRPIMALSDVHSKSQNPTRRSVLPARILSMCSFSCFTFQRLVRVRFMHLGLQSCEQLYTLRSVSELY